MHDSSFTRKPLTVAVAIALGSAIAIPSVVAAQEEEEDREDIVEEVVVVGIRGSLNRSMAVKRNSNGVVDAISAEDIGKFPDQNLAESLQRITGVSIDRQRGEGSQVTVRGFGPEYNLVTINGRQMPTHNGTNRSFDFADLASEGVAGVQVYKTGRADVPSGGVGSTINISTPQPLIGEQTASLAAKTVFDTSTRTGDEVTPEFSGIYLDRFMDDRLGIAITASRQVRNNGVNTAFVNGWYTRPGDDVLPDGTVNPLLPNDANQINRPQNANENYSFPQSMAYNIAEYQTERTNGQLVLQWAPNDTVTTTVDYIRSEFDLERSYSDMSAWFSNTGALAQSSEWTDGPIASPVYYTETVSNADFAMGTGEDGSKNLNESIGFNFEWFVTDRLRVEFDYHDSSAETGANGPNGTSSLITMASFNKVGQSIITGFDMPVMSLNLNSGGETNRPMYKNDMIITGSVFSNDAAKMDIEETRVSGTWDINESMSIDFGAVVNEVSNRSVSSVVQLNTWGGITDPGDIADIVTRASIDDQFDELSGHNHPDLQTEYFVADLAALAAAGEAAYAASGDAYEAVGDCGTGYCASTDWPNDIRTGQHRPANLYNGVLHPIIGYGIRGAIWYQGESNAGRAAAYNQLFPLMISTWRDHWKQGDFPFYWVQLADFGKEQAEPQQKSWWAELREAQTNTLALPNTGQAVIIDIGEGRDIHPRNKRTVGDRLVRHALAKDYGYNIASESPRFSGMRIENGEAIVTFDHVSAGGLYAFDVPEVKGFAIAGSDGVFRWAKARIEGKNQVVVSSPGIAEPVAVRSTSGRPAPASRGSSIQRGDARTHRRRDRR